VVDIQAERGHEPKIAAVNAEEQEQCPWPVAASIGWLSAKIRPGLIPEIADSLMYIPPAFELKDPARIAETISSYSFGILISKDGDSLFASHLPFLYQAQPEHGKLISHLARANRHWRLFDSGAESLVIFQGPHAYISPTSYVADVAVPTWNYVTLHVYGIPRLVATKQEVKTIVNETVEKHEAGRAQPWIPSLPEEMESKLLEAIVGFEMKITRVEGKFKLGQNRTPEDQQKMIRSLLDSGDAESVRLGEFMEKEYAARAEG
jgi:transcriptional regulator